MNAAQTNGVAITPRKVIDSSQAQGVPLNVVARLADAPRATPGAALAQALNHYASALPEFMAHQQRQQAEQQAAQDKLDAADGKQMATEAHATGSTPDRLRYMSDATQQSYQQADGVLAASEFENFVRPDLARLEADADGAGPTVDRFMQGKVKEYIEQKGLPEEARKTFMAGVAQKQDALKREYLKQSITENLHRQVDAFGYFATNSIQNGDALTPEGYASLRTYGAAQLGLTEHEINDVIVQAAHGALASGTANNDAIMAVLRRGGADGKGNVWAIPEYREKLDSANKTGLAIKDAELRKSQRDALADLMMAFDDRAATGSLSDHDIKAALATYDLTPAWAAGMHARNRAGAERVAKEREASVRGAAARALWFQGDPLEIEAFGRKDVDKAGGEMLADAVVHGDTSTIRRLAVAAARNGSPWDAMRGVLSSINTADTKRASDLVKIYETVASVSPDYAGKLVDTKTKAQIDRYLRETRLYGADDAQAWTAVRNAEAVAPAILAPQVAKVWKDKASKVPRDFDDAPWYKPWQSDTKVQNYAEVQSEVHRITGELLASGQYADSPNAAFDAALEKYKATHVRVGNRYVPTFGTTAHVEPQTAAAMTEYSTQFKNAQVKADRLAPEDDVWFMPSPQSPGKWQAFEMVGGVPMPLTVDGKLVERDPNAVRAHYTVWRAQEDKKAAEWHHTLTKVGRTDLVGADDKTIGKAARQMAMRPREFEGVTGMTKDGKLIASGVVDNRKNAAAILDAHKRTAPQGFLDFIDAHKP